MTRLLLRSTMLLLLVAMSACARKDWVKLDEGLTVEGLRVDVYYKPPDLTSNRTSKIWMRNVFPNGFTVDALHEVDCDRLRYRAVAMEMVTKDGKRSDSSQGAWADEPANVTALQRIHTIARNLCN